MKRICYICNTCFGEKEPLNDKSETHGLCPFHFKSEMEKIELARNITKGIKDEVDKITII